MVIEDFGPELVYIKDNDIIVAGNMSRYLNKKVPDLITIAEHYGHGQLQEDIYPDQFKMTQTEQQKDKKLIEK
eukprot:10869472-Ditylum_brightwellii.AAC.1